MNNNMKSILKKIRTLFPILLTWNLSSFTWFTSPIISKSLPSTSFQAWTVPNSLLKTCMPVIHFYIISNFICNFNQYYTSTHFNALQRTCLHNYLDFSLNFILKTRDILKFGKMRSMQNSQSTTKEHKVQNLSILE